MEQGWLLLHDLLHRRFQWRGPRKLVELQASQPLRGFKLPDILLACIMFCNVMLCCVMLCCVMLCQCKTSSSPPPWAFDIWKFMAGQIPIPRGTCFPFALCSYINLFRLTWISFSGWLHVYCVAEQIICVVVHRLFCWGPQALMKAESQRNTFWDKIPEAVPDLLITTLHALGRWITG